jgi:hypothetical protein
MKLFELKLRLIAPLVVVCCFVCLGSQSLQAQQTISYPNFSSSAGIQTNGNAAVTSNGTVQVLRLTPNTVGQVGSAWYAATLPLSQGFSTTFKFQLTQPAGIGAGDGFAFVIQNGAFPNGKSGSLAVGDPTSGGGAIGFQGLTHSLAIEFDTFCNPENFDTCANDFSSDNEVGVLSCGAGANSSIHSSDGGCGIAHVASPIALADGQVHTAVITYTPPDCGDCSGTLAITLDGLPVLTQNFDLASLGLDSNQDAFVGFTAATGAGTENHDILSWNFTANQNAQTQTVTLGPPGTPTTLTFNTDTYKITGQNNQGGEQLTVTAFLVPKSSFPSLNGFSNETCVPYRDYSMAAGVDTCVEFQATCVTASGGACNFIYQLAISYDLPADLPAIGGPDFLVAHGQPCPLTTDSTVQSIFLSYTVDRHDPTTKGGSRGPSCFVTTYTPTATPITTGGVSVNGYFVGFQPPIQNPPVVNPWEEFGREFIPIPLIWQEFATDNTLVKNPRFFSFCSPGTPLANCPANSVALQFVPIDCTTHAATGPATRANALFNFVVFNPFNNTFVVFALPSRSFDDTCQELQLVITGTGSVQSKHTALFKFN